MKSAEKFKKSFFDKLDDCRSAFMALGDKTRQSIIETISKSGRPGMRVGDITSETKLSRPAVSHHLKILKSAKLVKVCRIGTKNYYYVDNCTEVWEQIRELASCIIDEMKSDSTSKAEKIHN